MEDIERKYDEFKNLDPYPEIAPALLNSADIADYVNKIGMIEPFYEENLKPASYGLRLKGDSVYWESNENRVYRKLENLEEKDEEDDVVFTLKKNSIAYVQLEPYFRFPSYIAARFNLKIKHIYQGILLGTGPLVDPGYEGYIFAPLHNLTNNDYKIKIRKPFVWMEFTKLSSNVEWRHDYEKSPDRKGNYRHFDKSRLKQKATLSEYINDAFPNAPIISTTKGFFAETNSTLEEFGNRIGASETLVRNATDGANRATTQFNRAIIVSMVAIVISLGITLYQTISIHYKTLDYLREYDRRAVDEHTKFMNVQDGAIDLKRQILDLKTRLDEQSKEIDKLKPK